MRCHACDVAVGDGQRFCHECGATLSGVTDPTEQIEVIASPDEVDSAGVPTGEHDVIDASPTSETVAPPAHEPEPQPEHRGALPDLAATQRMAAAPTTDTGEPAASVPTDPDHAFRPTGEIDEIPAMKTSSVNPLDSVPWQTDEPPAVQHEPTVTMPAAVVPTRFDPTDRHRATDLATTGEVDTTRSSGLFDGSESDSGATYESDGFKLRASFVFAFLAMLATLMASIADVVDLRTSIPIDGISPGTRILEDFGTNLAVGGFIGTALMLLGGLAACFGFRWGAGLAGGSGLALAGWGTLTIGLFERPLFDARTTFGQLEDLGLLPPGAAITTTRDLGWFLVLAVGLLGGLVFLVSLRQAGTGGRRGLNPWVAALGALGTVVLAAGPLIPLGAADLSSNLGFDTEPRAFFLGRLVHLGLLVFTGVLGFLSVRTYGLGLAAGGMSIVIWLWATSLADLGSGPVGPALGNLGNSDTTPHAVTGVGVAVSVLMLAIAITIAVVSRPHNT